MLTFFGRGLLPSLTMGFTLVADFFARTPARLASVCLSSTTAMVSQCGGFHSSVVSKVAPVTGECDVSLGQHLGQVDYGSFCRPGSGSECPAEGVPLARKWDNGKLATHGIHSDHYSIPVDILLGAVGAEWESP